MTAQARSGRPLANIRVLDFTHAAAGPFATQYLADMGAEVIKIEKPGRGDGARFMGLPLRGPKDADYYLSINRNKKDILVDLQSPEGAQLIRDLAAHCDIVMQNFRPGVTDRLGLGYDDLRKLRRGLIYCSISAFGPTGPWSDRPANDIIMQSVSGLMGITGEVGGGPVRIGAPISDYSAGLFSLVGVLAALHARDEHPEGQHIQVAMLDASIAMMANYVPVVINHGKPIPRVGRGHAQIVPYQAFRCSDGEYVMVGAFTQGFWRSFAKAIGHEEWIEDARYKNNAGRLAHRNVLVPAIEAITATKTRAEWLQILEHYDVPCSPVYELHDAVKSEQAVYNRVVRHVGDAETGYDMAKFPIEVAEWPEPEYTPAPVMGEHTLAVLTGLLGLGQDHVQRLLAQRVIGTPDTETEEGAGS